jgi:hypothetical protein
MELLLHNGTKQPLTHLRAQVCIQFKGMAGFDVQTKEHQVGRHPFNARSDPSGARWVITAWSRCARVWENPRCPCLHSDPGFDDAAPGETVRAQGRIWFHEGRDIGEKLETLATEMRWPFDPNPPPVRRPPNWPPK